MREFGQEGLVGMERELPSDSSLLLTQGGFGHSLVRSHITPNIQIYIQSPSWSRFEFGAKNPNMQKSRNLAVRRWLLKPIVSFFSHYNEKIIT